MSKVTATKPKKVKPEATTPVDKSAKFKTIATRRTKQAVRVISNIGNLSNRSSYAFTPEQVDKIFGLIQDAVNASAKKFQDKTKKAALEIEL